jgi:cobalamin biosynthesis protein CobD/CbiB
VRLAGPAHYHGERVARPWIGAADWPADLTGSDLRRGLWLVGTASALAVPVALLLFLLAPG